MSSNIRLTIDLGAIVANWRQLAEKVAPAECAAVVKADAYGLGLSNVAAALYAGGCRSFYVAYAEEGLALRQMAPDAAIYLLNGIASEDEAPHTKLSFRAQRSEAEKSSVRSSTSAYKSVEGRSLDYARDDKSAANLIPVINSLQDLQRIISSLPIGERAISIALQIDTGLHRLGIKPADMGMLRGLLKGVNVALLMSHLANAEDHGHPLNELQLQRFRAAAEAIPARQRSFANSPGIFLGVDYHFDQVRPGAALYGINPTPGLPNPMRNVVTLEARIIQIDDVPAGDSIGYGSAFTAQRPSRIATLSIGYADGVIRALGNRAHVFACGHKLPIVGRVSMDLMTVDITALPPGDAECGSWVQIIGPDCPVDAVAEAAGTIGYEVLTGLGRRATRVYVNDAQSN